MKYTALFLLKNNILNLYRLLADSADNKLVIFFLIFPRKTGSDISCKLSPMETICMRCQILFSGENERYFKMLSCEKILPREPRLKNVIYCCCDWHFKGELYLYVIRATKANQNQTADMQFAQ